MSYIIQELEEKVERERQEKERERREKQKIINQVLVFLKNKNITDAEIEEFMKDLNQNSEKIE